MIEERLKYIYDDIYRWLVFAEAKNLAIITISLVIIENVLSENFNVGNVKKCAVIKHPKSEIARYQAA